MEYAKEKPQVTPSKTFLLPLGIGEKDQLSELLEVKYNNLWALAWVQPESFPVTLYPQKGEGYNSIDCAVFNNSLTLPGLVSEYSLPYCIPWIFGG